MSDDRPAALIEEKRFYDRFWALHGDAQLVEVYKAFGLRPFRRSSVLEGFDGFLRERRFGGACCVEIGTDHGLTALVLARHFAEVVSIDVVDEPSRHTIAGHFGVKNVRFVTVRDNDEKARVIAGLGRMGACSFDAAYVDGDHARDTEFDFNLVRRCGRVLFHEYWPAQPPVWNLVNGLRERGTVETKGKLALWTA